jgi:hypothetical protein
MVGGDHQRHLYVVLRPAVSGRRGSLAPQPNRMGRLRPTFRRAVVRGPGRVRGPAGRPAVGGRGLHTGRCRRRPCQSTVHVPRGRPRSRRRTAGRDAHQPARRSPDRRTDLYPRLGNATSAVGWGAARLRPGQRQLGRRDSLAARRGHRDDLDVLVATSQARVAPVAGGLSVGDGLRAGVLRRALRCRRSVRLGAERRGVGGDGSRRLVVVAPSRLDVSYRDSASGRSRSQPPRRTPGRPVRRRSPCAGWR